MATDSSSAIYDPGNAHTATDYRSAICDPGNAHMAHFPQQSYNDGFPILGDIVFVAPMAAHRETYLFHPRL